MARTDTAETGKLVRRRLRRIHKLYDTALAYVLSLNADYVLQYIVSSVGDILELDHCYVMLVDDDSGQLFVQSSWARNGQIAAELLGSILPQTSPDDSLTDKRSSLRRPDARMAQPPGERAAAARPDEAAVPEWAGVLEALVVQSQSPMIIPDTSTFPDFPGVSKRQRVEMPVSMVGIPLLFREKVIGTLTVSSWARRSFVPDEVVALTQLAVPASLAIENERLYNTMQERLREKEVLLEASAAMSRMRERDQILAALAAQMARVMEEAWCGLLLLEGERLRLRAQATWDVAASLEVATCAELGLVGTNRGQTVPITPLAEHPLLADAPSARKALSSGQASQTKLKGQTQRDALLDLAREHGCVAASVIPLRHQDRTLGVALVGLRQEGDTFREGDHRILSALANQAAIAIENAQLLADEKRQSEEKALLLDAARLAASSLHLEDAMDDFAALFARCLHANQCVIFRLSGPARRLELAASFGLEGGEQSAFIHALQLDIEREVVCHSVFSHLHHRLLLHLADEPMGPSERIIASACDATSAVFWPLVSQGPCTGVAMIFFSERPRLTNAQLDLMHGVVRQAAIFLRNTTLFAEVKVRAERMKAINDITDAINSTRDLPSIFSIVASNTEKVVPVDWTGLAIIERDKNLMRLPVTRFGNEVSASPLSFTLADSLVFRAAEAGTPVISNDLVGARSDLERRLHQQGLRSMLVIPLLVDRETVAALILGSREVGAFTSEHVEILQEMADHLATAIKNASMFEEITRMNQELRQMDAIKSDFLSTVAHELRTPLTIIKGYLFVLLKPQGLSPFVVETLETIDGQTDHLKELIENLLSLSRLESHQGLMRPNVGEVRLAQLVEEIKSNFKLAAKKKNLELIVEADANAVVQADRGMLVRVFYNLVGNALKFTQQGSIAVRVTRRDDDVLCDIEDSGIGIGPEHLGRIFERFYHVDGPDHRAPSGTGLGLAIVESIVAAHGGKVWVDSEVGRGTKFSFTLPLTPPPELVSAR